MTNRRELIRDALTTWAPNWPRTVGLYQEMYTSRDGVVPRLLDAEDTNGDAPFISVYSFPNGHTKQNNIPHVDTLFIDFDMEHGDYNKDGDREAWERDLSYLLVRLRRVAQFLLEQDAVGWRASLSGHKGVHLLLDFPAISADEGTFDKFVTGVNEYARKLVGQLMTETGISDLGDYMDVTSSDLGRVHRVPNTVHEGATNSLGEKRYCVPVSLEEIADMTVDDYAEMTLSPRPSPYDNRTENERAGEVIQQHIRAAKPRAFRRGLSGPNYADYERYQEYVNEQQNEAIDLDDVQFLTKDRPCVWRFHEREDKFDYREMSHYMEMFCIRELQEKNVPVDVMHEFFATSPDYDKQYTDQRIKEVISRGYNRFNVRRILENAPEFCALDDCRVCQRAAEDMETTQL